MRLSLCKKLLVIASVVAAMVGGAGTVFAAEKMRIMREAGDVEKTIKRLAAPYGFRSAVHGSCDFKEFRRGVEEFVNSER